MPDGRMEEKRGQRRKGRQTAACGKTMAGEDTAVCGKTMAGGDTAVCGKTMAGEDTTTGGKMTAGEAAVTGKDIPAGRDREFRAVWGLLLGFCLLTIGILALCARSFSQLPDTVGRVLSAGEGAEVIKRNSPLTDYTFLSPNADFPRAGQIKKITIHHMAGDLGLEALGETFAERDRRASANYGIDSSGRIGLYVEERDRAWTSSSKENDDQAVTIEVANDEIGGEWHVSDAAYEALITLCVDICERNKIKELVFTGDQEGNLTLHNMFSNKTECPGPYLESRMEDIAREVNERLEERRRQAAGADLKDPGAGNDRCAALNERVRLYRMKVTSRKES